MNIIKEFIEFYLYSKYAYLEYVCEIIICVCFTKRFFKNSQFGYDKLVKIQTVLLVVFKSLAAVLIADILYTLIIMPVVEAVFNSSGLPMVCKPIVCFVTLSIFEKVTDYF